MQERLEALMKRSLERSLQLEQRTKRWSRGCTAGAGKNTFCWCKQSLYWIQLAEKTVRGGAGKCEWWSARMETWCVWHVGDEKLGSSSRICNKSCFFLFRRIAFCYVAVWCKQKNSECGCMCVDVYGRCGFLCVRACLCVLVCVCLREPFSWPVHCLQPGCWGMHGHR